MRRLPIIIALSLLTLSACEGELDDEQDQSGDPAIEADGSQLPVDASSDGASSADSGVSTPSDAGNATTADAASDAGGAADAAADAQAAGDAGNAADPNAVAAGAHCDPVRMWPEASAAFEDEVLLLTNQARAVARKCGAASYPATGPLTAEPSLRCAARLFSSYMARTGEFTHTPSDGSTFSSRIKDAGYRARSGGENIAYGQTTPRQVVDGWLKSEDHCKNLMNAGFKQLGVGYAVRMTSGRPSPYWTQNFGTPF